MIEAVAYSNVGNVRSNHEDNYLLGAGQYIDSNKQSQMINNFGRNGELIADVIKCKIQHGLYYLICSDGITDIISEHI